MLPSTGGRKVPWHHKMGGGARTIELVDEIVTGVLLFTPSSRR
jgi:hypothetical protein